MRVAAFLAFLPVILAVSKLRVNPLLSEITRVVY